jgi:hypothetical protein
MERKTLFKKLKLKIPFVHYRLEMPEILQAALLIAVGLSATPILQQTLGLSYGAALTAVAIAEALGLLHVLFGDPVVPGWIASALSLVLVYLGGFTVGIESIHALIALQILVSLLFIILGVTGLAHKLINLVPNSLKAGILFGAAIAALAKVFAKKGSFETYPITIAVSSAVALIVVFSVAYKGWSQKKRVLKEIGKYGMLSSLIVAMIVGFATGEVKLPQLQWGFIPFSFGELFRSVSPFAVGFPGIQSFLTALPTAIAVYIIAFGEIITAEAVLHECQVARPNDDLGFNSNRTNIIAGIRNLILALFAPFTPMAGPLWAAVSVSIGERYKEGKDSMKTLFGGMGSFKLATSIFVLFMPVATLLTPILPVALACTLVVQGFACSYIAIDQVKNDKVAAGVAGITGAIIYLANLNWGLAVGIFCFITMENGIAKYRKTKKAAIEDKK